MSTEVLNRSVHKTFDKQRSVRESAWTAEIDHDKEWERRKDLLNSLSRKKKIVGRCASDCTGMRSRNGIGQPVRTRRSLTDADLDELRGCIDLGFVFKDEAYPELCETLPALELCYAISQQLKEIQRSSSAEYSSESEDSPVNSPTACSSSPWQIATPGDRPQQVKTRLRHWARAVACTVRQNL